MINTLRNIGSKIFWAIYAPMSAELWVKMGGNRKIREVKELLNYFGENLSTLEVGAAEGYITRTLAQDSVIDQGVAYDILPLRLERGYHRAYSEGLNGKIQFILGDAKSLPFENRKYDVVMLLDVLEHIPRKEGVVQSLKEAYRVASKGVIISVPHTTFSKYVDIDHIRILILHDNSWIYDPESFQRTLNDLDYNFRKISERKGTYLITK